MTRAARFGGIAFFVLKFIVFSAVLLFLWWWKLQPQYVNVIGRTAAGVLMTIARMPIEGIAVEVDPSGVLTTKIALAFFYQERRFPIEIGYLVANVPPYIALVLATSGLGLSRTLRIIAIGCGILAAGHVLFLVFVFSFARQIQDSPEIPTAIGLFIMTLPFLLWTVLAYWDKVKDVLLETDTPQEKKNAPPA